MTIPLRFVVALGLPLLILCSSAPTRAQTPPRWNVVLILTDDLDVHTLQRAVELGLMPRFKSTFVDQGVTFSNAFVTNSLCCPSRSTFLTGQYSHNTGVVTNVVPGSGLAAFKAASTLAVWLDNAGYRTSHVGKFLNGYGTTFPADHVAGQDRCQQQTGAETALYIPPGWDDWYGLLDNDLSTYRMYNFWVNDNCQVREEAQTADDPASLRRDGYQTDVLAWRAAQFLDSVREGAEPFYLEITPLAPHLEIFPGVTDMTPDAYEEVWRWDIRPAPRHRNQVMSWAPVRPSMNENMSDKPAWMRPPNRRVRPPLDLGDYLVLTRQYRHRLESMRAVDDLIGTVVDKLIAHGQLDRTLLVFTSDNGFMYGEHNMSEKLAAYEESIRIPLHVRLPGSETGRTVEHVVLNNDVAPTLAQVAGAAPDLAMDGTSFAPLLAATAADWRKRFLVEHWDSGGLIDMPGYDAVRAMSPGTNLLYLEYRNPDVDGLWNTPEFYDLTDDSFQIESLHLSMDPLRVLQRQALHDLLPALRTCTGPACRQLEFCPGPFAFCPTTAR